MAKLTVLVCLGALVLLCVAPAASAQTTVHSPSCKCANATWCRPLSAPPAGKELFVFTEYPTGYLDFNWTYVTTVAAFFSLEAYPQVLCEAHARGVRVATRANPFPVANLSSSADRASWVASEVARMQATGADGINVDIEQAITSPSTAADLTALVAALRSAAHQAHPLAQVSFDVAWNPKGVDNRDYDYASLATAADLLFVMGYDVRSQVFTSGPCTAGPNAGLPQVTDGLQEYLALGIPASMLVAGSPWYGRLYPCLTLEGNTCTIKAVPFRGCNCSDAASSELGYSDIKPPAGALQWDEASSSPFFNIGGTHQMWYDDARSLSLKYAAARKLQVAGVGMWTGDFSGQRSMWSAFDSFFQ